MSHSEDIVSRGVKKDNVFCMIRGCREEKEYETKEEKNMEYCMLYSDDFGIVSTIIDSFCRATGEE